jgi:hypothetical protein
MRGDVKKQASFLTIVGPEQRVPQDHPIRRIKALADAHSTGVAAEGLSAHCPLQCAQ